MTRFIRWPSAMVFAGLIALGGCGQHAATDEGQVVARVNGEEITVSQVNAELATVSAGGQDAKLVRQEVLRAIVFRTLLRQSAIKEKLDRRPPVRLLMDGARDKVLADSYMNSITGADKPPTARDVTKFIADHPLAFGERRIYRFERLILAADKYSDGMLSLFDQKPQVQTLDNLENYLNEQRIPFSTAEVQLVSTDFPGSVQDLLIKYGVGDNVVVRGPQSIIILKIKSWTEMPVQEADAVSIAATALKQKSVSERAAALRTQMIHDSKIEFAGEFTGMNADEPSAAPPASTGTAPVPDQTDQPSPAPAASVASPAASHQTDAPPSTLASPEAVPPPSPAPAAGDSPKNPQEGPAQ